MIITVTRDQATPAIAALMDRVRPERLQSAVGSAGVRLVATHLRGLGTNKRGWPSTGFWADAARATDWQPMPGGVRVTISKIGVRQRYYGGHIAPVRARALTIPISPVAYGHTAGDFPGSFVLRVKSGAAYIVQPGQQVSEKTGRMIRRGAEAKGNANRRIKATLNFLFKLVGGVDQKPDPNVLPSKQAILDTAKDAILAAI